MKTMIAMILLGAAFVVASPTASACSMFEDPTELTPTCVDQYEDGYGDETCESLGSHTESTTVTTGVPGTASLYANDSEYCFNGGFGGASYGSGTFAFLNVGGVGFVSAGQYESESDFGSFSGTDVGAGAEGVGSVGVGQSEFESDFGSYCAFYVSISEQAYETIPC